MKGNQIHLLKKTQNVNQLRYLQMMDDQLDSVGHPNTPDRSKEVQKSVSRRKKLLGNFFDVVGFKFEKVYKYIQEKKRASFREVDYESFLLILGLEKNYK